MTSFASTEGVIRGHFYRLNGELLADGYVELPYSSASAGGLDKNNAIMHHHDVAAVKAFLASEVDERRPLPSLIELFHLEIDPKTGSPKTDEVGTRLNDGVSLADLANGDVLAAFRRCKQDDSAGGAPQNNDVDSCAVVVDAFQHVDAFDEDCAAVMKGSPASKRSTKSTMCASEDDGAFSTTMPLESTMCASDDDDESHWGASLGSTAHPMSVSSPRDNFSLSSPRDFLASPREEHHSPEVPDADSAAELVSAGLVRSLFATPSFGLTGFDDDSTTEEEPLQKEVETPSGGLGRPPTSPVVKVWPSFGFSPPSRGGQSSRSISSSSTPPKPESIPSAFQPPSRSSAASIVSSTPAAEFHESDNPAVGKKRSVRIINSPMTSDAEQIVATSESAPVVDLHFRYIVKTVDFEALGVQRDLTLRRLNELGLDKCREWVWQQSYREHILWNKICRGGSPEVLGSYSTDRLFSFICKNKLAPNVAVAMAEHLREESERVAERAKERLHQAQLEKERLERESYVSDDETETEEDSVVEGQQTEPIDVPEEELVDDTARELDAMLNYVDETGRSCLMWTLLWQNERASAEIVRNPNFRQICQTDVWGGTSLSLALPLCGAHSDTLFLSLLNHPDLKPEMVDDAISSAKFIFTMDLGFCFLGQDTDAKARGQWRNDRMQEWRRERLGLEKQAV